MIFLEIFTVEGDLCFDITFYFRSIVNSSIFIIGIIVILLFLLSINFLFKFNLKVFLAIYLLALILYISRIILIAYLEYQIYIINMIMSFSSIAVSITTFTFIYYFKVKLGFSDELKIFERNKLEQILRVSEKINLEIMRNILELDQKTFQEKIIDYSKQYGMKVEGNNLVIKKENLDDFLKSLEAQFEEWEMEKQPVKKI